MPDTLFRGARDRAAVSIDRLADLPHPAVSDPGELQQLVVAHPFQLRDRPDDAGAEKRTA
jgi:hypothetical protein